MIEFKNFKNDYDWIFFNTIMSVIDDGVVVSQYKWPARTIGNMLFF